MIRIIIILLLIPVFATCQYKVSSRANISVDRLDEGLSISGGSNNSISFALTTQPVDSVKMYFSYDDTLIDTNVDSLTFTSSNYNTPQTITISRVINAAFDTTYLGSGIDTVLISISFSDGRNSRGINVLTVAPNASKSISYHGIESIWDTLAAVYDVESVFKGIDYNALRDTVIHFLYPASLTLPTGTPDSVYFNVALDGRYEPYCNPSDFVNFDSMNVFVVESEGGFKSFYYHIIPKIRRNKLFFVSAGHSPSGAESWDYPTPIQKSNGYPIICSLLVQNGYDVLFGNLPLMGLNTGPVSTHNGMDSVRTSAYNPVSAFLTGWIRSKNYLTGFDNYYLTGLSGGGWLTTMWSAIDVDIDMSFEVAGTSPIYVRELVGDPDYIGDYEQGGSTPGLPIYNFYRNTCSYLDLYVLASQNRKHYQLINLTDDCCYWGRFWQTWYSITKKRARENDGDYIIHEYIAPYHQNTVESSRYILSKVKETQTE